MNPVAAAPPAACNGVVNTNRQADSGGQRPVFVLHEHQKPRHHFDLRLERDGVLKSWAVPKGMPTSTGENRLAVAVADHDLEHAGYTDADKSIADDGWWELDDADDRRFVFTLHGRHGVRRYALIRTGKDWLVHLTRQQPGSTAVGP